MFNGKKENNFNYDLNAFKYSPLRLDVEHKRYFPLRPSQSKRVEKFLVGLPLPSVFKPDSLGISCGVPIQANLWN